MEKRMFMETDYIQQQINQIDQRITETEELLNDPEMGAMAADEIERLKQEKAALEMATQATPQNSSTTEHSNDLDHRNVIIQVKGAAGGDEAKIFSRELLRMYARYCETHGLKFEMIDDDTLKVMSNNAFATFKYEAGVHRVQRVPDTEKRGRVHTSTAVVSVLPELEDIDLHIRPEDIEFEAYRSGGHGGQNVNKVSTAVRLKHIPSGIVVTAQTERHQNQNRENAMKLLRAKLWEQEMAKRDEMISELRSTQVGRGDRSEKIRTYNFPQDRITDHRINKNYHNMPIFMDGAIEDMLKDLKQLEHQEEVTISDSENE
jgi:peptide chain release factor 1